MKIISHRGYWRKNSEKNTEISFERSFSLGFGTETDLRDYLGEIVISHDIPDKNVISLNKLSSIYNKFDKNLPLALNIKADGLQHKLKSSLQTFGIENYFVFDMSIPDTLGYLKGGIKFFSRQSEYEPTPAFYNECDGIWLDSFNEIWYDFHLVRNHLENGKKVAIVSPDLHKRDVYSFWNRIKENGVHFWDNLILCTDTPEEAKFFFGQF